MSALRPLPPRPNLEYERKAAKALLRGLRAGDPDAVARMRECHPRVELSDAAAIRLADAQLVIAREYGFTSWPRLVDYFDGVERQRHAHRQPAFEREFYEALVPGWLVAHRDRRLQIGRALAAYVPRFYGMNVDDVFAATVSEREVRLAMARQNGFASWDMLLERAATVRRGERDGRELTPMERAGRAIAAADLGTLMRVVGANRELLQPADSAGFVARERLLGTALLQEEKRGVTAMRPIVDWLVAQGLDLQHALNVRLCGGMHVRPESVRHLLDRGADSNWVGPGGIPVLEHALVRYWNGAAVDVLAARATPRRALWIAAGLGDLEGVCRSLDRQGKPLADACRLRPDFDAVGPSGIPSLPDPDHEELLVEAFFVAMCNGRTAVLEHMAARGMPVDSLIYGSPLITIAVGNGWTAVVECLVRCGADLDLRGWRPSQSARDLARELFEQRPQDAERRRIAELCGMDPDVILAERDARPVSPPRVDAKLQDALELAADDAFRLGQPDVRPENLLFGLLRGGGPPLLFFTKVSGIDFDRFHADQGPRLVPTDAPSERPRLPLRQDAEAAVRVAIAFATDSRREAVQGLHLLWALTRDHDGPAAGLLSRYGASAPVVDAKLEQSL